MSNEEVNEVNIEDIFSSRGRVKVLKTILQLGEVNVTQLIKLTRLNHKVVKKHIEYLKNLGLIEEIVIGRIKLYRPNWLNPRVKFIDDLMKFIEGY